MLKLEISGKGNDFARVNIEGEPSEVAAMIGILMEKDHRLAKVIIGSVFVSIAKTLSPPPAIMAVLQSTFGAMIDIAARNEKMINTVEQMEKMLNKAMKSQSGNANEN